MIKKSKIVKTSTKQPKSAKSGAQGQWEDPAEYRCMLSYQMMPAQSQTVDRLFFEFNLNAKQDEEMLFLGEFLERKGISERTWERWVLKSPEREELHREGMEALGRRREKGAMKRTLAEKTVHFMMPMYSRKWAFEQERQAKLGIVEEKPQSIKIVMESYKEEE